MWLKIFFLLWNNIVAFLFFKFRNSMAEGRCLVNILTHIPDVLKESSHYFFQYGRYKDCIDTPSMNYNFITLGMGQQSLGLYFALCLPDECTSNMVKNSLNEAFHLSHLPFTVFSIDSDIQDYNFSFSPVFYITIAILSILTLLVLFSTFFYKKFKQTNIKSFALQ